MFNLTKKPLRIAIIGWLIYGAMLIAVGILWYLGTETDKAIKLTAPAAILAFICWITAVLIGFRQMLRKENKGHARGAVLTGLAPIVFLGIYYWRVVGID